jgi:hypothetical protein
MYAFPLTFDLEAGKWPAAEQWQVKNAKSPNGGKLDVELGWIGEIKPLTESGIRAGLGQLYTRRSQFPDRQLWLITYTAHGRQGERIKKGPASAVAIYARQVKWPQHRSVKKDGRWVVPPPKLGDLYTLGKKSLPAQIDFPKVDQPGFFGLAVEGCVQEHVRSKVKGQLYKRTGGSLPGPDLRGRMRELAALYGELSRVTGDPLFAEIATELQPLTA